MAEEMTTEMNPAGGDWRECTLRMLIDAAKKARKGKDEVWNELERFKQGDYPESMQSWDPNINFRAKFHVVQQYEEVIGPRLYQQNPKFRVTAKEWADQANPLSGVRAVITEDYLNYCIAENDFRLNIREEIGDSFLAFGTIWPGIHPDKPHVTIAEQVSYKDVWFDPNTKKARHGKLVIRRRWKEKFLLKRQYPGKAVLIDASTARRRPSDAEGDQPDASVDMVEYYEVYMLTSLRNYRGGIDGLGNGNVDADTPRKYVITDANHLLEEADWETPFHTDGEFPCQVLSYYTSTDSPYPTSPLEPAIGWIRARNWAVLGVLAKYYYNSREIIAVLNQNGMGLDDDGIARLESGESLFDIIQLNVQSFGENAARVGDYIQQIKLSSDIPAAMGIIDLIDREIANATGLTDFITTGTPEKQTRSAAAAEIQQKNSHSRIDDMRATLDQHLSDVGRKMALVARYHMDQEDVAKCGIGEQAAADWGRLMDTEDKDVDVWQGRFVQGGLDENEAMQLAQETVAEAVTLDEWAAEIDYDIEVGSTMRKDPAREEATEEVLFNHVVPTMVSNGDLPPAMVLIANAIRKNGGDEETADILLGYAQQKEQERKMMEQQQMAMQQQELAMQQQQQGVPA